MQNPTEDILKNADNQTTLNSIDNPRHISQNIFRCVPLKSYLSMRWFSARRVKHRNDSFTLPWASSLRSSLASEGLGKSLSPRFGGRPFRRRLPSPPPLCCRSEFGGRPLRPSMARIWGMTSSSFRRDHCRPCGRRRTRGSDSLTCRWKHRNDSHFCSVTCAWNFKHFCDWSRTEIIERCEVNSKHKTDQTWHIALWKRWGTIISANSLQFKRGNSSYWGSIKFPALFKMKERSKERDREKKRNIKNQKKRRWKAFTWGPSLAS